MISLVAIIRFIPYVENTPSRMEYSDARSFRCPPYRKQPIPGASDRVIDLSDEALCVADNILDACSTRTTAPQTGSVGSSSVSRSIPRRFSLVLCFSAIVAISTDLQISNYPWIRVIWLSVPLRIAVGILELIDCSRRTHKERSSDS